MPTVSIDIEGHFHLQLYPMSGAEKPKKSKKQSSKKEPGSFGFLERILSFVSGGGDPDREKKRLLKEIAKQLKKQRFKFYRPKSGEVLPGLAKFFYDIYKAVAAAHLLIDHAESSNVLKTIVIETFLKPEQRDIQDKFDEEVIRVRSQEIPPKDLAAEYKEHIIAFFSAFDNETVRQINSMYNLVDIFLQIIHFDYYFLIKKFDSGFAESDFKYKPRFEAIGSEYLSDDLKDFIEIMPLVNEKQSWTDLFEILRIYKGTQVMSAQQWKTALRSISEVQKSGIFPLMVQHIDGNPFYAPKSTAPSHKIVEEYLSKLKTRIEMTIQKILNERRKNKIDDLAQRVFGTTAISRMRNYTEEANVSFSKKMLGGYVHVAPLNYLKSFLLDHFKGEIKATIDLLLIRGQWAATVLSQQLSESFHHLMDLTDQLLKFDEALAEDGHKGAAIKTALYKVERDKGMMKILKQYLSDINGEAFRITKESAQNLISVAKYLKSVLEDYKTRPPEMILNWREIETATDGNIEKSITVIYKKIYYFTQLLQYYTKS
jgi:hypothetical protein